MPATQHRNPYSPANGLQGQRIGRRRTFLSGSACSIRASSVYDEPNLGYFQTGEQKTIVVLQRELANVWSAYTDWILNA